MSSPARCPRCTRTFIATPAGGTPPRCPHCGTVATVGIPPRPSTLLRPPPPPPPPKPHRTNAQHRPPSPAPPPPRRAVPHTAAVAPSPLAAPVRGRASRRWFVGSGAAAVVAIVIGVGLWRATSHGRVTPSLPTASDAPRASTAGPDSPPLTGSPAADATAPSPAAQPVRPPDPSFFTRSPIVRVQFRSFNRIGDCFRALAGEKSPQYERWHRDFREQFGQERIPGVDPTKPLGGYVDDGGPNWSVVTLIPLAHESAFRDALTRLGHLSEPAGDGVTLLRLEKAPLIGAPPLAEIQVPPRFVLRVAHGYAYFTSESSRAALTDARLFAPGAVFDSEATADLTAAVRLDRVFPRLRLEFRDQMASARRQLTGGPMPHDLVAKWFDLLVGYADRFFEEGQQLTFNFAVNGVTQAVEAELNLWGRPGSDLARGIASLAGVPSAFAGLTEGDPAARAVVNVRLPAEMRDLLRQMVDAATNSTLQQIRDANERREYEVLFRTLGAAIAAGELDLAWALRRGGRFATAVGAVKVPNGRELDRLFREEIVKVPDPADRGLFDLDFTVAAGATVHRYRSQAQFRGGGYLNQFFGDNPTYYGFRPSGVIWAAGDNGLDALTAAARARTSRAPLALVAVNVKRLNEILPLQTADGPLARDLLPEEHPGRVRLTLEGGTAFSLRASVELALLRFVSVRDPDAPKSP
jgi:hypothetical protein